MCSVHCAVPHGEKLTVSASVVIVFPLMSMSLVLHSGWLPGRTWGMGRGVVESKGTEISNFKIPYLISFQELHQFRLPLVSMKLLVSYIPVTPGYYYSKGWRMLFYFNWYLLNFGEVEHIFICFYCSFAFPLRIFISYLLPMFL